MKVDIAEAKSAFRPLTVLITMETPEELADIKARFRLSSLKECIPERKLQVHPTHPVYLALEACDGMRNE